MMRRPNQRLTLPDQIHFFESILMLLQSGMNVLQAIQGLRYHQTKPLMNTLLIYIEDCLKQGFTLSQSLSPFVPSFFDLISYQLIYIGERSGQLEQVITHIIELKKRRSRLVTQLRQASAYPLLTISVGIIIMIILMTIVLPQFKQFYHNLGHSLPWITQLLIKLAQGISTYGPFLLIVIILAILALIQGVYYHSKIRHYFFQTALNLPIVGPILYYQVLSHSLRHLQLLLKAGLPLNQAVETVTPSITIPHYHALFNLVASQIQTGQRLSTIFYRLQLLPSFLNHILVVGEQSGHIDNALAKMADYCDHELNQRIHRLQQSLGPVIMLILSLVVAFVLIAMYLPMFTLGQAL